MHPLEVAGLHPGDPFLHHSAPLRQGVQGDLHGLLFGTNQLCCSQHQLFPGQEDVAVVQIVLQLVEHRRLQTAGVVSLETHGQSDLIHVREGHTVGSSGEDVGIVL